MLTGTGGRLSFICTEGARGGVNTHLQIAARNARTLDVNDLTEK